MPSKQLNIDGAVTLGPIQPTSAPFPSGQGQMSLTEVQTTTADLGPVSRSINSPVTFIDLLAAGEVTNVRFFKLTVRSGSVVLRITSPAAAMQEMTISSQILLSNPTSGTEWTAIAVQGVADIEYMIAGT